jgi:hypothetical protein
VQKTFQRSLFDLNQRIGWRLDHRCRRSNMGEPAMLKSAIVVFAAASVVAVSIPATAAKKHAKPTYEQAYALCKAQLDRQFTSDWHTARYTAGSSCMYKYGYRL